MRNIFLFIRRYFNFLFFLVIQVIALSFLFRYNQFHEAAFMGIASEITGRVGSRYSNIEYYFELKKINDDLASENERLNNIIRQNFQPVDTTSSLVVDSIRVDSLEIYRRYKYYGARVVESFVSLQTNYFMIHRGASQGVRKDMAVVGPNGIVGRIVNVSDNYSTVMILLNRQFRVNGKLLKTGERGTIEWDGKNTRYVNLRDIPRSVKVEKGDTVVTSELSSIFPPNILIGVVSQVDKDPGSNFYLLRLRTTTNFSSVHFVYVVEDLQRSQREDLKEQTKRNE